MDLSMLSLKRGDDSMATYPTHQKGMGMPTSVYVNQIYTNIYTDIM